LLDSGDMIAEGLLERARRFALDVIDLCLALPTDELVRLVRPQLLRAGSGVVSNYRAARRSRSRREFVGRLAVVIEEADEAELWMDVLQHRTCGPQKKLATLRGEAGELVSIFARSRATAIANARRKPANSAVPLNRGSARARARRSPLLRLRRRLPSRRFR